MIDIQTIILFSTASLALAVTSGPDMILVAARSAAQGRMAGLVTQLGVSAGSAFHAIILALGLSQLFLAVPYAYDLVRYLSAAYLLYLAWQAFTERDGFSSKSTTVKKIVTKVKVNGSVRSLRSNAHPHNRILLDGPMYNRCKNPKPYAQPPDRVIGSKLIGHITA